MDGLRLRRNVFRDQVSALGKDFTQRADVGLGTRLFEGAPFHVEQFLIQASGRLFLRAMYCRDLKPSAAKAGCQANPCGTAEAAPFPNLQKHPMNFCQHVTCRGISSPPSCARSWVSPSA